MIKVSVIGATGYAGIELVRLLYSHPHVQLIHLVSQSFAEQPISHVYPNFKGLLDKACSKLDIDKIADESDVVFTSLPHGISNNVIPALYDKGKKVIDLSGDFRYKSVEVYEKWYGTRHVRPDLLQTSVYGLPELHREEIKKARLIGNPGCYPTCAILGLAPLVKHELIDLNSIIIDAKSGATGAGREPSQGLHFCEVDENVKAYKVATHRHTSEIEQELSILAQKEVILSFTPHLLPVKRGILSTIYANLKAPLSFDAVYNLYNEFYANEPFIVLHPEGSLPEIKYVNGSNNCHIGFVTDKRTHRIVVVAAIDNLIKGAGGQAVQNMNILFGLEETAGLRNPGWYL
ncbi:N-acetyl-gamma-glutamyl-phosphate reductase [Caldicoprobacter guelmensis]|uniref:N-acetyl-gamma-glutamyl-phosphate reductase n=1 Tax=Caldicoprobacter guelmensis TaxID=1170224 RepID=UPI0019595A71|nr:N-acetyl-gamma-glutamyl-phosphate reductase [Caldicoprobacter guelmensis]MBM7583159.1 N-acetyl-gamma-glutamyl-phosphate reductase [Caldicoprobacter guelmensis]